MDNSSAIGSSSLHGDDEDRVGDEEADSDGENEDSRSFSASSPVPADPAVAEKWKKLLDFPLPGAFISKPKAALGPVRKASSVLRRWTDSSVAQDFAPLRQEDCLHQAYAAFKKADSGSSLLSSQVSGLASAAGHAILSASKILHEFFDGMPNWFQDPAFREQVTALRAQAKVNVFGPLEDAAVCCAAIHGRATSAVRNGVISAADSTVKSVLQSKPPADGFFFGNPQEALHSTLSYAFMSSSLNSKASTPRGRGALSFSSRASKPLAKPAAAAQPASSSSTSSRSSGNAAGRSSRGGKGGQKKK